MPTTCGQPGTSSQIRAGVFAPRDAQHKSLHKCDRGARAQAHVTPRSAMLPLDPRHRHTGIEASCSPTPGFCANRNVPRTPALAPLLTPSGPRLRSVHGSLEQSLQKWLSPKCSVQNAAAFFDFPLLSDSCSGPKQTSATREQACGGAEKVERLQNCVGRRREEHSRHPGIAQRCCFKEMFARRSVLGVTCGTLGCRALSIGCFTQTRTSSHRFKGVLFGLWG